jgi:hypothetical protein
MRGTIDTSTGVFTPSTTQNNYVSDFIQVEGKYYCNPDSTWFYTFKYDSEKNYIGYKNAPQISLESEPDVEFIRVSNGNLATLKIIRAEYFYSKGEYTYTNVTEQTDELLIKSVRSDNVAIFENGINLFDYYNDYWIVGGGFDNDGFISSVIPIDYEDVTNTSGLAIAKYFPLSEGQTLFTNYILGHIYFYDSDKELISHKTSPTFKYSGNIAPEGCAYARILVALKPSDTQTKTDGYIYSFEEIKNLMVWVKTCGEIKMGPPPTVYPARQISGENISPDFFDKAEPSMEDSYFLSAMKCMAIRECNAREHTMRFGNFNMYLMMTTGGWDLTKRMLMDYGVDFCGFEEVTTGFSIYTVDLAKYLQSWQFPYGFYTNQTDGNASIDKSLVSRYEVLSSTKLTLSSSQSNNTLLNCKIKLPRYMDVVNPDRILSVYVGHFPIAQSATKIAFAQELLGIIAEDDSDFVVICSDSNDFGTTVETKDYWNTLANGGFRPAIPPSGKTITADNIGAEEAETKNFIDQFFISDNIEMRNFGVKNTRNDYAVPGSHISDGNADGTQKYVDALSDHDFVWADLYFDYSKTRAGLLESGD